MATRRDLLRHGAAALVPLLLGDRVAKAAVRKGTSTRTTAQRVVVVGAGAFGGWTALNLAKRGASVT
ncbi:MAG: hypothetical protein ACRENH_03955, partial [Gemmatimonadaceae bacterium]